MNDDSERQELLREIEKLRLERQRLTDGLINATRQIKAYEQAIAASGKTKYRYISEVDMDVYQIDENGEVIKHSVPVSWVTIKQLLGHVRDYADSLMKQRLGSTIPDGGSNA